MQNKGTERPYRVTVYPGIVRGPVTAPPSKSLCHRAWILAALARGKSRLVHMGASEDLQRTEAIVRQFGARIWHADGEIWVEGIAGQAETEREYGCLDCGESGSSLRFLLPVAAALGISAEFVGQGRLPQRPLAPYFDIFEKQDIAWQAGPDGLPLQIRGRLKPGRYEVEAGQSSQFVSGLLMALPLLKQDSELLAEGEVVSRPYLRMTAAVMTHHGVTVERVAGIWHICGGQQYRAAPLLEEPDWSAAAFWLVLHRILLRQGRGEVHLPLPPPPYLQGDAAVLDYLDDLPAEVDISDTPDLLPPLALYAALLPERVTRFTHGAFLRRKESDRLSTVTAALNALGAWVRECEDGITVSGVTALHGGEVSACGDHRIAMLVGCAAMTADAPVLLDGAECAAKSYPTFWRELAALGGKWEVTEP